MKPIVISQNNIIKDAVRFNQKSDIATSLTKSQELEVMRQRMLRGEVVRFCYLKADNITLRVAVGTLQEDSVEANINGRGLPKRLYGQFAYLDTQRLAWRSFKIQNFIGIID
jgi:hypothetical protein